MSERFFGEEVDEILIQMEQWSGCLAVVTEASNGIGAAICTKLVKNGVTVIGLSKNIKFLKGLESTLSNQKGTFRYKECDLTNEEDIFSIFEWIDELGAISILINSAAVLKPSTLLDGETEDWKVSFDINVLALCICTKKTLESMQKHGVSGHIININSAAGYFVPELPTRQPLLNVYPATKHAIRAVTETLRKELNRINSKTKVSSVSPGLTLDGLYQEFSIDDIEEVESLPKLDAEDVSNAVMYVLSTPPGVQVHDIIIRAVGEKI